MKINTKFFGEIEIDENELIEFKYGIPGFENERKFAVLDIEGKRDLKCLQSAFNSDTCLLMISPWEYFKEYEIDLSDEEAEELGITSPEDTSIYNIIAVRKDKITTNLVAPIIINQTNKQGKQIILSNTNYSIRQDIECLY